jgi:MOB kinase activator 1
MYTTLIVYSAHRFATLILMCTLPSSYSNKSKTFKPKRNIPEGTKQHELQKYAEATLGSGNLRLAVTLPEGEDLSEWLAVNST